MSLAPIISDTISVIEKLKFLRQKIKHENSQLRLRNINEVENGDVIKVRLVKKNIMLFILINFMIMNRH